MVFIDTNVLIRLATNDLPEQVAQAEAMLAHHTKGGVIVIEAVIEECCFILEFNKNYGLPRRIVHQTLTDILQQAVFGVSDDIRAALELYGRQPKLDFVDCLLAVKAGHKKGGVLTFDKKLQAILR